MTTHRPRVLPYWHAEELPVSPLWCGVLASATGTCLAIFGIFWLLQSIGSPIPEDIAWGWPAFFVQVACYVLSAVIAAWVREVPYPWGLLARVISGLAVISTVLLNTWFYISHVRWCC